MINYLFDFKKMKSKIFLYFIYSRFKFLYILSTLFISMHDLRNMNVYLSEIRLVIIKGTGTYNFLFNDFIPAPSEVIINDNINALGIKSYDFIEEINNVVIKFSDSIESCQKMFYGLDNIIEIDLSNFDFSKVENMHSMFSQCLNLEKIKFGKINTSLAKTMSHLFINCTKLTSIDLSHFNTSSVTNMRAMFALCKSLTSIDASKFNTQKVETMLDMFAYCYELITVNVSSFDTSKVIFMKGMFFQCFKLKYLDLSNFNTSSVNDTDLFFRQDL